MLTNLNPTIKQSKQKINMHAFTITNHTINHQQYKKLKIKVTKIIPSIDVIVI